jgi:hypothetical protein
VLKNVEYEPPLLQDIGSLQQLTMQDKDFGASDGVTLNGVPIGNTSVA